MRKNRFTDCNKWRQAWYRQLPPNGKLVFLYLTDNCDDAGVWEKDLGLAAFMLGLDKIELEEGIASLGRRVQDMGDYLLLPKFIAYQYPNGLREDYNPHKPALRSLARHSLTVEDSYTIQRALAKPCPRLQGTGKDKGKDKGKGKSTGTAFTTPKAERLVAIYHRCCPDLPKVRGLTKQRRQAMYALAKAMGLMPMVRMWQAAQASDFLTGRQPSQTHPNFRACLDWLLKHGNAIKVLEGKYANRQAEQRRFDYGKDF